PPGFPSLALRAFWGPGQRMPDTIASRFHGGYHELLLTLSRRDPVMNATPLLSTLLAAIHDENLEVILIGNAAAAMHGAPVTTLDFDFMFRETAATLRKLKRVAARLEATILRPFYPVSKLYRMVDDATGLQADFMPVIHGVRSFEGLRSRAVARQVGRMALLVASIEDIIASKRAAGRERDLAVLPVLEKTRDAMSGLETPARKRARPRRKRE
ncbi:MAG: hypothetical protein WD060_06935, partial [Pirellulales bacterium]